MIAILAPLLLGQTAPVQPASDIRPQAQVPSEIVAAAPSAEWVTIAADDLLVMELAPDAAGRARQVVIQLMPAPFAQGWVANIRALARARWWDGLSVNRVQDNYVAQWGDASEKKPLPAGLRVMGEGEYSTTADAISEATALPAMSRKEMEQRHASGVAAMAGTRTATAPDGWHQRDSYAAWVEVHRGWPLAESKGSFWPVHCYGTVGVGRNLSPDTGTGAELYAVIGHAPRHLDRNIAVVGRVIEGIEHLSSLPRGTEALGFYRTAGERTPIRSLRLASELSAGERPRFEYLSTEGPAFAAYVAARASRRDAFFFAPAGGVDVCNLPVPVRRAPPPPVMIRTR